MMGPHVASGIKKAKQEQARLEAKKEQARQAKQKAKKRKNEKQDTTSLTTDMAALSKKRKRGTATKSGQTFNLGSAQGAKVPKQAGGDGQAQKLGGNGNWQAQQRQQKQRKREDQQKHQDEQNRRHQQHDREQEQTRKRQEQEQQRAAQGRGKPTGQKPTGHGLRSPDYHRPNPNSSRSKLSGGNGNRQVAAARNSAGHSSSGGNDGRNGHGGQSGHGGYGGQAGRGDRGGRGGGGGGGGGGGSGGARRLISTPSSAVSGRKGLGKPQRQRTQRQVKPGDRGDCAIELSSDDDEEDDEEEDMAAGYMDEGSAPPRTPPVPRKTAAQASFQLHKVAVCGVGGLSPAPPPAVFAYHSHFAKLSQEGILFSVSSQKTGGTARVQSGGGGSGSGSSGGGGGGSGGGDGGVFKADKDLGLQHIKMEHIARYGVDARRGLLGFALREECGAARYLNGVDVDVKPCHHCEGEGKKKATKKDDDDDDEEEEGKSGDAAAAGVPQRIAVQRIVVLQTASSIASEKDENLRPLMKCRTAELE